MYVSVSTWRYVNITYRLQKFSVWDWRVVSANRGEVVIVGVVVGALAVGFDQ